MQWEPLPGGWSGESFLTGSGEERSVVRICAAPSPRGALAAQVDASVMRLLAGLVPVPEVLEVRPASEGQPALLITRYVDGVRADDMVRGQDLRVLEWVGEALGRVAGTLAGMPTLESGHFIDEKLTVLAFDEEAVDLSAHVAARSSDLRGLTPELAQGLVRVAARAQLVLDAVGRTCVVHGDLNAKNVVLEPVSHRVAAVVDFEHAHSGSPYADLGSLIRFDRHPVWEHAVLKGWAAVRQEDTRLARLRARCADLHALLDLAARPGGNLVVDLAEVFLHEVARTQDVHAHP